MLRKDDDDWVKKCMEHEVENKCYSVVVYCYEKWLSALHQSPQQIATVAYKTDESVMISLLHAHTID